MGIEPPADPSTESTVSARDHRLRLSTGSFDQFGRSSSEHLNSTSSGQRRVQVLDSTRSQQEFADMYGELLPTGGGDPIPLLKTKLLVGRRDGCDIVLRFPNVSSHHCELELLNGYWRIRDLGSRNGIKVNGTRVEIKTLLPGDEISVAKHHYEVRYTPEGDAPPPDYEDTMSIGLLEKAGLAKTDEYPRPPVRGAMPPAVDSGKKPAPAPKPGNRPDSDESIALQWLQDDDE